MNSVNPIYVSCGANKIYTADNFPGPPVDLNYLIKKATAGDYICELFPSYKYHRPIELDQLRCSSNFKATLAMSRTKVNDGLGGPASALFSLLSVIIRDRVMYLNQSPDYPVIYETHRAIDRANSSLATYDDLQNAIKNHNEDGLVFLMESTGCFNYGHWLVDDLTRLEAFWRIRERHPTEHITVVLAAHGSPLDAVKEDSINFLLSQDKNFTVRSYARPESVSFNQMYFASPTTVHSTLKSPDALLGLRSFAVEKVKDYQNYSAENKRFVEQKSGKRIFVSRDPIRSRGLKNSDDIFAVLEPLGFEHYTLENSTFTDQVVLFTQASIVIGNMGAGMTNTLFCRSETPILNLAPEGWDEPFFWDLAVVMGQRHFVTYGSVEGESFESGFKVDPNEVLSWIKNLTFY